ncbi:MAG: arsenosugar biosynthesis radical SAM (seleno)protein ArsS [Myxococcota bacterium]
MTEADFEGALARHGQSPLRRQTVTTLQLNVTLRCNLACHHCHVESGPKRTEAMPPKVVERLLELVESSPGLRTLDLTGGAPEMHPQFRDLVAAARSAGLEVLDRCNLTIFYESGYEDLPEFLARHGVTVIASLPCYTKENVESQRGRHVFQPSIEALRWLNRLGYGVPDSGLRLDLVYNPLGPSLPPPQDELERDYKRELGDGFGITFDRLLTITNMPIKRFGDMLARRGQASEYMSLLVNHFNPATVPQLMCRSLVSVGQDGQLFDCDFNQALELPLGGGKPLTIWEIERLAELEGGPIATAAHCFGCTAGAGSSCGGALA